MSQDKQEEVRASSICLLLQMTLSSEEQEEKKVLSDVSQHGSGELGPEMDPSNQRVGK